MYFGTMYLSNKGHLMPPNKKKCGQNKMLLIQFRLEIEMVIKSGLKEKGR